MPAKPIKLNVQRSLTQAESHLRKDAFDQARAGYAEILERFPKNSRAQAGLAAVKQKAARAQRPELTQAMVDKVFAQRAEGKLAEATDEARLLSTAFPDEPVLQNFLATCYFETGQYALGRDAAKQALKLRPDYPEASLNLSIAYRMTGQLDQALSHGQKAVQLRPGYTAAHSNLGLLLEQLNRPQEALESLQKAIDSAPNNAEAHNALAAVLRFTGQPDKAASSFARALELNPNMTEVHCNLSELKTYQPDDPQIEVMEKLWQKTSLSPQDKFPVGFALAKAHEDLGDLAGSFGYLQDANRLRKQAYPYDPFDTDWQFSAIKAMFDDGPLPAAKPAQKSSKRPVFIVGMPRSGTTLIEQILASHSGIHGADELGTLDEILCQIVPSTPGTDAVDEPVPETLARGRDAYLTRLDLLGADEATITDKMPLNFKWIGFIAAMFDNARVIHVARDPMAICWSNFKRRFAAASSGFTYDLDDLADYYEHYQDMMEFWQGLFPDLILTVNYEQLTQAPDAEIRRMLDFLGLDWQDSCLAFHQTERSVRTGSAEQVRRQLYTGSSDAWTAFADQLAPLKARLGL